MKLTARQFFFVMILAILAMQNPVSLVLAPLVLCMRKVDRSTNILIRLLISIPFAILLFILTKFATDYISSDYLPLTPHWIVSLVLLAVFAYGAQGNPERLSEIFGIPILLLTVVVNILTYPSPVLADIREARAGDLHLLLRLDFVFVVSWMFSAFCAGAIMTKGIIANLGKRLPFLCAIAAVVALLLVGCWDGRDIQTRNIATMMAANRVDGVCEIVVEIADIKNMPDSEVGKAVLLGRGNTWDEAFSNLNSSSSREIYPNALKAIVLGQTLASDKPSFDELLEILQADRRYRKSIPVTILDSDDILTLAERHPVNNTFVGAEFQNSPITLRELLCEL